MYIATHTRVARKYSESKLDTDQSIIRHYLSICAHMQMHQRDSPLHYLCTVALLRKIYHSRAAANSLESTYFRIAARMYTPDGKTCMGNDFTYLPCHLPAFYHCNCAQAQAKYWMSAEMSSN